MTAVANASALTGNATAEASVYSGVYQHASATGATGVASAIATNSGSININANANALAAGNADATASGEVYDRAFCTAATATAHQQ